MGRRSIEAPEVKAEDAAALQDAKQMVAKGQRAQAAQDQQHRHDGGGGDGKAPEN